MKKTNIKTNKRKLVARVILLIFLAVGMLNFVACTESKHIEAGLYKYGEFMPEFMCGYQSDDNVFDIDDVTFDFYYGYTISHETVPIFELYFYDENENMHLIKKVNEELTSEKYNIQIKYVPFLMRFFINNLTYNHSERITIPKEVFIKTEGYFFFVLSTESMYYGNDSHCYSCVHKYKTHILAQQILYYKIDGDCVVISHDL